MSVEGSSRTEGDSGKAGETFRQRNRGKRGMKTGVGCRESHGEEIRT